MEMTHLSGKRSADSVEIDGMLAVRDRHLSSFAFIALSGEELAEGVFSCKPVE